MFSPFKKHCDLSTEIKILILKFQFFLFPFFMKKNAFFIFIKREKIYSITKLVVIKINIMRLLN